MAKPIQPGQSSTFARNIILAAFGLAVFVIGIITGGYLPPSTKLVKLPMLSEDTMELVNPRRRTAPGNESCVVVGCHTPDTPGADSYWNYYRRTGYAFAFYAIDMVTHKGRRASDKWCDVPVARDELRLRPHSKIIYVDVDTKINVKAWCDLPQHDGGPLIINSLTRGMANTATGFFVVEGTQIQTNAFRVAPGEAGLLALKKWEDNFYRGTLSDQGALHRFERGLCGVPGWIACYSNPEQQGCHCFGSGNRPGKVKCIADLFNGTLSRCKLKV